MSKNKEEQNLAKQIDKLHKSGEFNKALENSEQVLNSKPPDLEAYNARWRIITEMFSEVDAKERIYPEIETVLRIHPETSELYHTVHRAYKRFPGRAKNVPKEIFEKMLKYPGTITYLSALLGLAEQSEDVYQQWYYYQRIINECTVSDGASSWYMRVYIKMLGLVERDPSLADDHYIDELIDGHLNAQLYMCWESQQWYGLAYTDAVKLRIKYNNRLDKALETLDRAEIRLGEKEEQEWLVNTNEASVKFGYKEISRLRAQVYYHQERWSEAYDGLNANAPDFLGSLSRRFSSKSTIKYFYMLGRSAEGIENWEKAKFYYTNAHFHPKPHSDAQAGLKRVYQQIKKRNPITTFETFLKEAEAKYRVQEEADREHIRQKLLSKKLNKKAADFCLKTLDCVSYTLSDMSGKVVMLDVGASWCGPCNMAVPQLKLVYEHFKSTEDFVFWGINDGETPQKVQKSLDKHQPPWTVLLDPNREVAKTYNIRSIPTFILIDKNGYWQYRFAGSNLIDGQPLIWMIESLLSD